MNNGSKTIVAIFLLAAGSGFGGYNYYKNTVLPEIEADYQKEIAALKATSDELTQKLGTTGRQLEAEIARYQQIMADAAATEDEKMARIAELEAKLVSQKEASSASRSSLEAEIASLKGDISDLKADIARKTDKVLALSQELVDLEAEVAQKLAKAAEDAEFYKQKSIERTNNTYDFELELERQLQDEQRYQQDSRFLDHLSYQTADSGHILRDSDPVLLQGVSKPRKKDGGIELIVDREGDGEFPYALAVVDKQSKKVFKVFARPSFLSEDASTDGKGIWLSGHLNHFAYKFSAKEQKLLQYRLERDPDFQQWFDRQTDKIVDLCGSACQLEWVDIGMLLDGDLATTDAPIRDAGGQVSYVNQEYTAAEGVLSFDDPSITTTVREVTEITGSGVQQGRVPGFRVTAFSSGVGEGAVGYREWDISKGVQLTFGPLGQWNETSGILWTARGEKLAPFPYSPDVIYATVADGYLQIEEAGSYEFIVDWNGLSPDSLAVLVNDKLVIGGLRYTDPIAIEMESGEYPIKVIAFNPSPNYGLTELASLKPQNESSSDFDKMFAFHFGNNDGFNFRGKQFVIGYRRLQDADRGFKPINDALTSDRAGEQPENRFSGPLGEISYEKFVPTFATQKAFNRHKGESWWSTSSDPRRSLGESLTLNEQAYASSPETGTSEAGLITKLKENQLVKYSFTYDAKKAGTHFFLPLVLMTNHTDLDEDSWGFNFSRASFNSWDTLGVAVPNRCKYELRAYDQDVSQTVPITIGNDNKGTVYKAGLGSDYYGHLIVTEPAEIRIEGEIACERPFDLKFLTKGPMDLHFRPFEDGK